MKTFIPLFVAIAFSCSCLAQRGNNNQSNVKMENTQLPSADVSDNDLAVVSYHVEERINMKFGSRITTYDVLKLSLVGTNDLGENNVRIVTPKFAKVKPAAAVINEIPKPPVEITPTPAAAKNEVAATEERSKYAYIDILATYERVIDRGYKTVEMLSRVANGRFFKGDLVIAAKYYSQLFDMKTDLDVEYYFRYAKCLEAIGQNEKAKKMMDVFEKKNAQPETPKAPSK